jgi:predicted O-methyltransferase YrrM
MNQDSRNNYGYLPDAIKEYERTYERSVGGWNENNAVSYASVELEVGHLLHALVLLLQPTIVLETGTYRGYSTACIAAGLASLGGARQVVTIDPLPQEKQIWSEGGLESFVTLRRERSQDAYPDLLRAGTRFDMLVLDSDHRYDTLMTELVLYEPLLNIGGTIILHDSLYFDGVGVAVRQLLCNPRFQGVTLDTPRHALPNHRCPGITIVRKDRESPPQLYFDNVYHGWEVGDAFSAPLLRT